MLKRSIWQQTRFVAIGLLVGITTLVAVSTVTGGPGCSSSAGLCMTGMYSGQLSGSFTFIASSLSKTVDTPTTSVVLVTGDRVIQTKGGTLTTKDAMVLRTTGASDFAEVDTIVSSTGEWAGATGRIDILGILTPTDGAGDSMSEKSAHHGATSLTGYIPYKTSLDFAYGFTLSASECATW